MYQLSLPKIHKEGFIFIGLFALISIILSLISTILGYAGFIITAWCAYFFRDPNRVVPQTDGIVVSPADGVVHAIVENSCPPQELELENTPNWTRVSIFLNIFNVHVNRVPTSGKIIKSVYNPGKFLNASLDKASIDNERQVLLVETTNEKKIIFTQIAGLIARRIRCDIRKDDHVKTGQRFGLIRFGSRCDIYLPKDIKPKVIVGQKTIAGETLIAHFHENNTTSPLGEII